MGDTTVETLFSFIPLFESGAFKDAHSLYITSGECPTPLRDLQDKLQQSGLASPDFDWMGWIDQARPFLQSPEKILSVEDSQLEKLISLAAYSDRFNKSFFPHLCSSGFMEALLKRLYQQK